MSEPAGSSDRLARLRRWRNAPAPDFSLAFLKEQFKRQIARPHQQLGRLVEHWQALVPAQLVAHSRLDSFSRGILRVGVDSSAHLFELDRLLRSGLERQIIQAHRGGSLRRVQLFLDQQEVP